MFTETTAIDTHRMGQVPAGARLTDTDAGYLDPADLWTPAAMTLLLFERTDEPDVPSSRSESPA